MIPRWTKVLLLLACLVIIAQVVALSHRDDKRPGIWQHAPYAEDNDPDPHTANTRSQVVADEEITPTVKKDNLPDQPADAIDMCRDQQVKFFLAHKDTFRKDDPRNRFLDQLFQHFQEPCGIGGHSAIIDVGANTGQDIDRWNKYFGEPAGCVDVPFYYFEPNRKVQHALQNALHNKGYSHQVLIPKAISNQTGEAIFFLNGKDGGANEQGALGKLRWRDGDSYRVEVETLDGYFKDKLSHITDVPILKVDVEGHEMGVFLGAPNVLKKTRFLLFECSDTIADERGTGFAFHDMVNYLERQNFLTYKVGSIWMLKLWGPYWDDTYQYWVRKDQYHNNSLFWSNCMAIPVDSPIHGWMKDGLLSARGRSLLLC